MAELSVAQQTAELYINLISPSIYLWEFINLIPAELALYQRRGLSLVTFLWFVMRYGAVVSAIISYFEVAGTRVPLVTCRAFAVLPYIMLLLVNLAASGLFALRTFAIWSRNHIVLGVILALMALQLPPALYDLTAGTYIFADPMSGMCFQISKHKVDPTLYLYLIFFLTDLAVVVLSTYKLFEKRRTMGTWSPIMTLLLKDGLVYFLVTDIFHLANLALFAHGGPFDSQILTSPDLYITAIMGQRVVIHHLRDFDFGTIRLSSGYAGRFGFDGGDVKHRRTPGGSDTYATRDTTDVGRTRATNTHASVYSLPRAPSNAFLARHGHGPWPPPAPDERTREPSMEKSPMREEFRPVLQYSEDRTGSGGWSGSQAFSEDRSRSTAGSGSHRGGSMYRKPRGPRPRTQSSDAFDDDDDDRVRSASMRIQPPPWPSSEVDVEAGQRSGGSATVPLEGEWIGMGHAR